MRYIENPPNPYEKYSAEFIGEPPETKIDVYEETATRSMIVKSWSPDLGTRFVVNCYRGCIHGCTYCFARQYHEFIGFGAGTDFETKIIAKVNSPSVLRKELLRSRKRIPHLEFSFATDPYLPVEAAYGLTRKCLSVCAELRMPVAIITKSPLVTRDLDVIGELDATVIFSIPFLSVSSSRPFEPYVPTPEARFAAMKKVSKHGIDVGLALAPVIPGYNDSEIPGILEKARENGAGKAFMSLVHFETESSEAYFRKRLRERAPAHEVRIINQLKREKGGSLRHRSNRERNRGRTEKWSMIEDLFKKTAERLGFEQFQSRLAEEKKPRPEQPTLFGIERAGNA